MGAVCHIDMPLLVEPGWACAQKVFGVCIWPKTSCRSGYTNIGLLCALTSAGKSAPPGFSGTFLDPMKNSYPRAPSMPNCGSKQNQAGLCYEPCKPGYTGVGPVCWGNAPPNWVECGMGAAKDKTVCEHVVFDQVASVGNAAIKIATMGSTDMTQMQKLALSAGIITAKQLSHTAIDPKYQLKLMQKGFQTFYETALLPLEKEAIKQGAKLAGKEVTFPKPEFVPEDQLTPEDIARISASIAGMADPTGLVSMGANYTYPKCSKYFGDPK
jgi:hypothetical protein